MVKGSIKIRRAAAWFLYENGPTPIHDIAYGMRFKTRNANRSYPDKQRGATRGRPVWKTHFHKNKRSLSQCLRGDRRFTYDPRSALWDLEKYTRRGYENGGGY